MILEKVTTIVSRQMGIYEDDINLDNNLRSDLGADELDEIEIAMIIEEEFDIEVPDEDLEKIYTVKDWVEYIKANFMT